MVAVIGGFYATDPSVSWLQVFAVAGIGGTLATGIYAVYMAVGYKKMSDAAGVKFP